MDAIQTIKPKRYHWFFLHSAGLALSFLNKIRHSAVGYRTPRPFSVTATDRSVNYCLNVVMNWEEVLRSYTGRERPFGGRHVLEIGPGPDLGTGLVLLALGAKSYCAIDKNNLVSHTPEDFYKRLFEKIRSFPERENARKAFEEFREAGSERFSYIYNPDFDLTSLQSRKYEILVTQAVLEHLDDMKKVFTTFRQKLSPDGLMIHEVDLSTHTRMIKNWDPLNILRYPDTIYHTVRFDGSPNRLRMSDYVFILNQLGYKNVKTLPIKILDLDYTRWVTKHLSHPFRDYSFSDLQVLSFYLLASVN